jgi:sialate O-acetylesterase
MTIALYRPLSLVCAWAIALLAAHAAAPPAPTIQLPSIFSENMVLQRDVPIPVWGWAPEGTELTVALAAQKVPTVAKDGSWRVTLPPMAAGGPYTFSVMTKRVEETILFTQVMVGEVWLACGQSNMLMTVTQSAEAEGALAQRAQYPHIRMVQVGYRDPHVIGTERQRVPMGFWGALKWENATYLLPRDSTKDIPGCTSAVSYYFARELTKYLKGNVAVGMIEVGAIMPVESWVDEETLTAVPALAPLKGKGYPNATSRCFNANIAPLAPFPVRGFIYYQGEMNAGRGDQYRECLPALIRSWRKVWGNEELPFLIVQLPGFVKHDMALATQWDMDKSILERLNADTSEHGFSGVREAQLLTWQGVPRTGLAVTLDLGDPFDIHPKRKRQVGERLFLQARRLVYGEPALVASGPVLKSCRFQGSKAVLSFTEIGAGLEARGPLAGFELSADGKSFQPATAAIVKDTVVVERAGLATPTAVRYGWAGFPTVSLWNKDGLPASPFRYPVPAVAEVTPGK